MKKTLKKIGFGLMVFMCMFLCVGNTYADDELKVEDMTVVPDVDDEGLGRINDAYKEIGKEGGKVMDNYRKQAENLKVNEGLASGIITWNTIMEYLLYVIKFLSQLGIAAGVVYIMIAGYNYVISVFKGGSVPKKSITNAIIGVIIVIFSYAIMKFFTSIVGLS